MKKKKRKLQRPEPAARGAANYDPEPARKLSPDCEEAVAIATDILYLIDERVGDDAKERVAPDFFESVTTKSKSIRRQAMHNSVTDRQLDSLRNMLRAVKRWVHDDDDDDD
jgi:hypothetical protein